MIITKPVPYAKRTRIQVSSVLRKRPVVLKAFLETLGWQEWPDRTDVTYRFIDDGLIPEAVEIVHEFLKDKKGSLRGHTLGMGSPDFSDENPVTHQWTGSAMERVGRLKDQLIEEALENQMEAV